MSGGRSRLLFEDVAETLLRRVRDGRYPLGARIPSEAVLADELKVSRPTVKRAVRRLEALNILECRPAVGSFVVRLPADRVRVGYVMPHLRDPFHMEVIRELDAAIHASGGSLLVAESHGTPAGEAAAAARLKANGASGLVVAGTQRSRAADLEALGIPHVWCGGVPRDATHDGVTVDNDKGIDAVIAHLASLSVRTAGYASCLGREDGPDPRHEAFLRHTKGRGLRADPRWQFRLAGDGEEAGKELMGRFLARPALPEAVVCCDDWTAIGLIRAALAAGLRIPEQLKVTGFDNLFLSRYLPVPLTTVDYRIPELARTALGMLLEKLGQPEHASPHVLIDGTLIVRASTVPGGPAA